MPPNAYKTPGAFRQALESRINARVNTNAEMQRLRRLVTFDRLLARTRFAALMRERLRRLEDAFGTPINVEFAQVEDRFYLLQCRPLVQAEAADAGKLPRGVAGDDVVFFTRGLVRSGVTSGRSIGAPRATMREWSFPVRSTARVPRP